MRESTANLPEFRPYLCSYWRNVQRCI